MIYNIVGLFILYATANYIYHQGQDYAYDNTIKILQQERDVSTTLKKVEKAKSTLIGNLGG